MKERELHKFRLGRTLAHRAQDDFEEGYIMLGHKAKDFVKRILVDVGAIHDDESADQVPDDGHLWHPLPNMLIDGILMTGGREEENRAMGIFELEDDESSEDDDE